MNWIFLALLALMVALASSVFTESDELYESRTRMEWGDEERDDNDEGDSYSPVKRDLGNCDEYTIQTRPKKFHHNFGELLNYSLLFFEAQKSGKITKSKQKLPWRASSCLSDSGLEGEDLTGGWYDAGDNVKFNFPMAFSSSVLAWSLIEFPDAYKDAGVYNDMLSALKGVCEYFTKCHTGPNEYYYQVADAGLDHRSWQRPEDIVYNREPFRVNDTVPGSDVVSLAAAALATCSVAYKDARKGNRARIFREEAVDLYRFATTNIGTYPPNGYYINNKIGDELLWAATWLHLATGEEQYLQDAEEYFEEYKLRGSAYSFGWADTREGSKLLLYKITGKTTYRDSFTKYMDTCYL
ncbi:endoglucanase F-like [Ptychodera flava]|uniref:endoglucanase F-like n=1 Tax=Ptychodera flava TaxID=63121 RepID=UPI00396A40AE